MMYFNGLDMRLLWIDFLVLYIVRVMVVKSGGWCVRLVFLMIFPSLSDPDSQENHECVGSAEISV